MQPVAPLGLDAAKNIVHLHGVDAHGQVVLKKRRVRTKGLAFVAGLAPRLMGLEASGSAHDWARELTKRGQTVQLISPQFVKPDGQGNQNDPKDAAGICEAVGRPQPSSQLTLLVKSLLNRAPSGVTRDGVRAEQSVPASAGALPRAHLGARRSPARHSSPRP